jgi:hypothetical protein
MDILDIFLNKYSYKFLKGYPDMNNEQDVLLMESLLSELGINKEETPEEIKISKDIIDSKTFEEYVLKKYIFSGQKITGLDELYKGILVSSKKDTLFDLIKTSGNKSLKAGKFSIQDIENTLFNLILSFVKIPSGEPSELWFAIMYNGKVKGGVQKDDAETDVKIGDEGVSIKNYPNKISTLDFGALPSDELKKFKTITNLLIILTNVKFTAGLGRDSLQGLLDFIKTPKFQSDLKELLKIGKDTNIKALENIYNVISPYLPDGDTEKLVDEFIDGEEGINKLIVKKIEKVQWWAIINKNNLYLESSKIVIEKLRLKDGQLSLVFGQIKGNNLFVNGNKLIKED